MGVCHVNKCCCCIDLPVGVRIISLFLIFLEVMFIVLAVQLTPQFVFFIVPTCTVGIICHTITFGVVTFGLRRGLSRWLLLPWLIFIMVLVVGLILAAVLQIVIPLGSNVEQKWGLISGLAVGCIALAALYLYFWIVVLELFIKMGPVYAFDESNMPPLPVQMGPQNYQVYQPFHQYPQGHIMVPVGSQPMQQQLFVQLQPSERPH